MSEGPTRLQPNDEDSVKRSKVNKILKISKNVVNIAAVLVPLMINSAGVNQQKVVIVNPEANSCGATNER